MKKFIAPLLLFKDSAFDAIKRARDADSTSTRNEMKDLYIYLNPLKKGPKIWLQRKRRVQKSPLIDPSDFACVVNGLINGDRFFFLNCMDLEIKI